LPPNYQHQEATIDAASSRVLKPSWNAYQQNRWPVSFDTFKVSDLTEEPLFILLKKCSMSCWSSLSTETAEDTAVKPESNKCTVRMIIRTKEIWTMSVRCSTSAVEVGMAREH
jgi:hypothetical protein